MCQAYPDYTSDALEDVSTHYSPTRIRRRLVVYPGACTMCGSPLYIVQLYGVRYTHTRTALVLCTAVHHGHVTHPTASRQSGHLYYTITSYTVRREAQGQARGRNAIEGAASAGPTAALLDHVLDAARGPGHVKLDVKLKLNRCTSRTLPARS